MSKLRKIEKLLGMGPHDGRDPPADGGGHDVDPIEDLRAGWRDSYGTELPECWEKLARYCADDPVPPGPVLRGFTPAEFEAAGVSPVELLRALDGEDKESDTDLPQIPEGLRRVPSSPATDGLRPSPAPEKTTREDVAAEHEEKAPPGEPEGDTDPRSRLRRRPGSL